MLSHAKKDSWCDSVIQDDEFTATQWPHRWHLVERVLSCQLIESAASQVEMDLPWDIWCISLSTLLKDAWPHIDIFCFLSNFPVCCHSGRQNTLITFLFFNHGLRVSGVKLQVVSLNGTNGRQRDNRIITAKSFLSLKGTRKQAVKYKLLLTLQLHKALKTNGTTW